eukprot:c41750_g1_i1 orf=304-645(+)
MRGLLWITGHSHGVGRDVRDGLEWQSYCMVHLVGQVLTDFEGGEAPLQRPSRTCGWSLFTLFEADGTRYMAAQTGCSSGENSRRFGETAPVQWWYVLAVQATSLALPSPYFVR